MSGYFLEKSKSILIKGGFLEANIKTLCPVTNKVASDSFKAPDFYWLVIESNSFYYPWGKVK
jgi:hypothetical protein